MTVTHTLYWLGVWLLSPSRGALMLKCVFIGVVLKVASMVLVVPALLLLLLGSSLDSTGLGPGQAALLHSRAGMAYVVLGAPMVETVMLAGVFGLFSRVLGLPSLVAGAVVVVGAVLLHEGGVTARSFVAFVFAAFSAQYALFREHVSTSTTILGVAVTHATINVIGVGIWLAIPA